MCMVNILNIGIYILFLFKELPIASDLEYLGAFNVKVRQRCLTKYLAEINLFNVQDSSGALEYRKNSTSFQSVKGIRKTKNARSPRNRFEYQQ